MDPGERSRTSILDLPPELLLIEIICFLPFKQAAQTSVVRKRWRSLYHEMRNVVFKESEFVKLPVLDVDGKTQERVYFVQLIHQWISRFPGRFINRFELHFPTPNGFQESITSLVQFAVSKHVKILVLDFSDPVSDMEDLGFVVRLPHCVYDQTTIESLNLRACYVNPSVFKKSIALRSLAIGQLELKDLTTLLSKFPSLESLRFTECVSLEQEVWITLNQLKEMVFENCDFSASYCELDLPEVVIFKCSGTVPYLNFNKPNERVQEVYLDFLLETEHVDGTGVILGTLLNGFSSAKTLTVCPFLLQMIPHDEHILSSLGTRHLVMKTNLHPYEFMGISLMIDSCKVLESVTFEIVPTRPMEKVLVPREFNANTYWLNQTTHECMEKTLKEVVVKGFSGSVYEEQLVKYLIKCGLVMERLNVYLDQDHRPGVEMAARRLCITLHNA